VINTEYIPYTTRWYLWLTKNDLMILKLKTSLISYFNKAKKLSNALPYLEDEIKKHEGMAIQYLEYWDDEDNQQN
jgi:hypothetical protein